MMELGDRSNGACFGVFGDEFNIYPVLPAANANVYMMAATANREAAGWRSGGFPPKVSLTLSGNWATVNTPLYLGYRNGTGRVDFRGQIGEVLLFDRVLDESDRIDLEDYLVNKWTRPGAPFNGAAFDVAAEATLDLGGARAHITVSGAGAVTNGVLGAGFVISPAGDAAIGELTIRGVTFTASAPDGGPVYRVTTSGDASDRLLIDGDLSALTVVPATGGEITGKSFVIATGAITEKPALGGFPSKFKLILLGRNLVLSSLSGTLLILN
jgi:hypothetical protein